VRSSRASGWRAISGIRAPTVSAPLRRRRHRMPGASCPLARFPPRRSFFRHPLHAFLPPLCALNAA
jgi:hypothetical protein